MNVNLSNVVAATFGATAAATRGHGVSRRTLDAVAQQLGTAGGDLTKALDGGQSMADLAQRAGVAKDDLVTTIAGTLPATGRDGATVDTTLLATRIADHVREQRPTAAPADPSSGSGLGQGIDALSAALGIGRNDLMQRLADGTGITDLLAGNPDLAAHLTVSGTKGAILDGYA